MPTPQETALFPGAPGPILSVDMMGGDHGPDAVLGGVSLALACDPDLRFLLHGPDARLRPLLRQHGDIASRVLLCDAPDGVPMDRPPREMLRAATDSSMRHALDSVRDGQAEVCLSCGNTGALLALAMLRLRPAPGVRRPAIAALWPAMTPRGFNVVLDVGADLRADPNDLAGFAQLGVGYARRALSLTRPPRVGLLNVGVEAHKGRPEQAQAHDLIAARAAAGNFLFVGFVEGTDIPTGRADVIVTDGFSGNIALKSAEGTARLIQATLTDALSGSSRARLGGLLARPALRRASRRIDPRRANGGAILGLNGKVVKSHGAADATAIAAAIGLAARLARD